MVFIMPPSAEELKRRLVGRGTETEEVIQSRLERAVKESEGIERYDYLLVNDDVERCSEEMHRLIQIQHNRAVNCLEFIGRIQEELKKIAK